MKNEPLLSVIVPAHNEQLRIASTLESLLAGAGPGEIDVIVVPNACSDDTATIARRFPDVRVVETSVPGKVHAIGLGLARCRAFPRLVLDADVRLSTQSVRALVARLDLGDGVLASAPRVEWDYAACGPLARRAHRAHDTLMANRRVLSGVGAYLLSEEACRRVFPMPDVVADDEFAHRCFEPHERRTVSDAVSTTRPAPTLVSMIRRRARGRFGNRQLAVDPGPRPPESVRPLSGIDLLHGVANRRVRLLDSIALLIVVVGERALAMYWRGRGRADWSSDRNVRRTREHV